jgi:hypothetical protein
MLMEQRLSSQITFSPLASASIADNEGVLATYHKPAGTTDETNYGEKGPVPTGGATSSVMGASFNFINSIVGAGIIGIPYAIQQCGFVVGILMLALVAYLVDRSVVMLIDCGIKVGKLDYEDLSEHLLGWRGYYLSLMVMFMFAYGAQVSEARYALLLK